MSSVSARSPWRRLLHASGRSYLRREQRSRLELLSRALRQRLGQPLVLVATDVSHSGKFFTPALPFMDCLRLTRVAGYSASLLCRVRCRPTRVYYKLHNRPACYTLLYSDEKKVELFKIVFLPRFLVSVMCNAILLVSLICTLVQPRILMPTVCRVEATDALIDKMSSGPWLV